MRIVALLISVILTIGPVRAEAQEVANNARFGDWVVNCEAVTTTRTACRLVQLLTRSGTNNLVARFVGIPAEDGAALLVAQVPMGAFLPAGAVFRAEDNPNQQSEMIWQRCAGQLCEAAIRLQPADMEAFTRAGAILFGYRMQKDAEPIIVRVDVSRFAEAMAAISAQ